ncbi:hypothetical protein WOLCODRAFT_155179 [Wolfiporia cocos MD-104 SS10]|uniref:F-box domain-containing protein n=1 Tax=Wolfiporia cocos (strain MD-104) TaxID=742152 RepID=A0A2H3IX44_WOLCO|nr:hypothetical protein WOLCODRAFT_155179 [Wolfiporia cocos MD-104 SS10]
MIPQSVFLHLSSFHSITRLGLNDITLPSIAVLLRLVCAFDRLEWLDIHGLRVLDRRAPPASRRWAPSPSLKALTFRNPNLPDELRTLGAYGKLETSGGSETVLFLSKAVSCSDLNQLLHHAGKALREFRIFPLGTLSGAEPHITQYLRVPDVDLSRNVGLRDLTIQIGVGDMPAALLERVATYSAIQRTISSTCPTVFERIKIIASLNPSAASPSIMSHVLHALHRAVCPPDHSLAPEKYTSLKSVDLWFYDADEASKRQMEADWDRLAPIWFPSFYPRGIMRLRVAVHPPRETI